MKKFFKEFKEFISKGNVMDMAVGIIIGSAFTGIVNSFVSDIISPFLGLFGGVNFDSMQLKLIGDVTLNYGSFITNVINFIIIALVIFCMVKLMNKLTSVVKHPEEEKKPTTKKCPFCQSEIAIAATRCPQCTSMLEDAKEMLK